MLRIYFLSQIVCILTLFSHMASAGEQINAISVLKSAEPDVMWETGSQVVADINCDGKDDVSMIGKTKDQFIIATVLGPINSGSSVSFVRLRGYGNRQYQDSVSEPNPKLTKEMLDYDPTGMVGDLPGFLQSKTCTGLNLSSGETDSFHFYWNHASSQLEWWRL